MGGTVVGITQDQLAWARLRRSGLVEPFNDAEQAAATLLGIQAQIPIAAAVSLGNRVDGLSAAAVEAERVERRTLVRFWGQRNTVHLFAAGDWPLLHDALADSLTVMQRKLEEAGLYDELARVVRGAQRRLKRGETLTYEDVRSPKLEAGQDTWVVSYAVFMNLVRAGIACHGPDQGSRSSFVHREHWLPDLDWNPPGPRAAGATLAERYLTAYGPAEARDLAFWFGTTVREARRWIADRGEALASVRVAGREMCCRRVDLDEIVVEPPIRSRWPVHLLYRFDPLLLGTKDKSWLVDDAHYKRVWKAAAHIEPVLLVRGRIAGTWRYDRRASGLRVRVAPFAPLAKTVTRTIERRARRVASFLELPLGAVEIERI